MRTLLTVLVVAAMSVFVSSPAGAAAPPDRINRSMSAATWLLAQVTPDGTIVSSYTGNPDLGTMRQAVLALAARGVGKPQVDAMMSYLEAHLEAGVDPGGSSSSDDPGALALTILDAIATGRDPHTFGSTDLVARLLATQRPDGLFGLADRDPTYDGAFRQSLSLLALRALGIANTDGDAWLADQQCATGSFLAYRVDTTVACPPVDAVSYSGPDTNSTSFAAMALHADGNDVAAQRAVDWLLSVRAADNGFPYYGDATQASDANSTGVVLLALTTIGGTPDPGAAGALATLQVGCDGPAADIGGIAFQAQAGPLLPDSMATVQALLGLAGTSFPLTGPPAWGSATDVCTVGSPDTTTTPRLDEHPRTGSHHGGVGCGCVLDRSADREPGDSRPMRPAASSPRPVAACSVSAMGPSRSSALLLVAAGVAVVVAARRASDPGA